MAWQQPQAGNPPGAAVPRWCGEEAGFNAAQYLPWERGADGISERYRLLYKSVLGIAPPTAESPINGAANSSAITLTITIQLPPYTQTTISAPAHIPAGNIAANGQQHP